MSVQAITCALAVRGITASEKLLLLVLSNYADEHMQCFPSQKRLAEETGLTDRTLRTVFKALEDRRMVSRESRRRADGYRASDKITLHFAGSIGEQAEVISGEKRARSHRKFLPTLPEVVSPLTTFEPSKNRQKNISSSARADGFDAFWLAYPRKVGKGDARKHYAKALGKIDGPDPPATLLAALARVKPTWTDPQFIPHPATWLNQERWEDGEAVQALAEQTRTPAEQAAYDAKLIAYMDRMTQTQDRRHG